MHICNIIIVIIVMIILVLDINYIVSCVLISIGIITILLYFCCYDAVMQQRLLYLKPF